MIDSYFLDRSWTGAAPLRELPINLRSRGITERFDSACIEAFVGLGSAEYLRMLESLGKRADVKMTVVNDKVGKWSLQIQLSIGPRKKHPQLTRCVVCDLHVVYVFAAVGGAVNGDGHAFNGQCRVGNVPAGRVFLVSLGWQGKPPGRAVLTLAY